MDIFGRKKIRELQMQNAKLQIKYNNLLDEKADLLKRNHKLEDEIENLKKEEKKPLRKTVIVTKTVAKKGDNKNGTNSKSNNTRRKTTGNSKLKGK